jgi:peptidoglycan DL-endopeptidase CwlO
VPTVLQGGRAGADDAQVRPVVLLAVFVLGCLLAAGAARAGGPVYTVVPGGSGGNSLTQAIRDQLNRDKSTLAALARSRRALTAQLSRTKAELSAAADPFPSEDAKVQLTRKLAANARSQQRIRHAIRGLELALRPVQLPPGLASQPPAAIGAYAVTIAERYLGVRYLWGGDSPDDGFDCSGFVQYVYAQLGIQLPHYAASQYAVTAHVDSAQLEPGDLLFFEPRADGPGHVGIYVGGDVFIEAPHTGDVVKFQSIAKESQLIGYIGASRPGV